MEFMEVISGIYLYSKEAYMAITQSMKSFFDENGYLIVKQAVTSKSCERLIDDIWRFIGKSPDEPNSWYLPAKGMDQLWDHQNSGMIPLFHNQTMWDHRQAPLVYQAFSELLQEEKLWVSIDRINMKPPKRNSFPEFNNHFIHWDLDTSKLSSPMPYGIRLQGVLCLADTSVNQGGFQCVPKLYVDLEDWISKQPINRDPRVPNLEDYSIEYISANAGDLIIWDSLLPHGNGENLSNKPRFAQYITLYPARRDQFERRQAFVDAWKNHEPFPPLPTDPREWEKNNSEHSAILTALGRKLLGIESWW